MARCLTRCAYTRRECSNSFYHGSGADARSWKGRKRRETVSQCRPATAVARPTACDFACHAMVLLFLPIEYSIPSVMPRLISRRRLNGRRRYRCGSPPALRQSSKNTTTCYSVVVAVENGVLMAGTSAQPSMFYRTYTASLRPGAREGGASAAT